MRVGILEIITGSIPLNRIERIYNHWFRKQFISIMPQAVAVWCRELGHNVFYSTYYGQEDPKRLMPDELDILFISTFTQASALAYALSKLYRQKNTITVIGGPHARAFPADCLRFFDFVVHECDKALINHILCSDFDHHSLVTSEHQLKDIPSVQERLPEIISASFTRGKPSMFSAIPILSSIGCPYHCDFCVDWNKPYSLLPLERLNEDLNFIAEHMSNLPIAYHDANFGIIEFDRVMEIIETIPGKTRNPYALSCSLSILKDSRLSRLKQTNCVYLGLGVESWDNYSTKAGIGSTKGLKKLESLIPQFEAVHQCVPSLGACFIFGTDCDKGNDPIDLTKEFIRRLPYVWPGINIPVPFGGTPLFDICVIKDRILKYMPFSFYFTPYLVIKLRNYTPVEYYEKLSGLISYAVSFKTVTHRISRTKEFRLKTLQVLRTMALQSQLSEIKYILNQMKTDREFRIFHEGRLNFLPEFYRSRFKQRLGIYAELISDAEMVPELEFN